MAHLYWLAGFLEGEGWFGHRRNGDLVIQVASVDRDTIDYLQSGLGFIGTRKERQLPSGKVAYIWTLTNQRHAAGLMMTLLPLMRARRAERIRECLAEWKGKRLWKLGPLCSHGHELAGKNLILVTEGKYTKRRCKMCGVLRMRKHRAAKRQLIADQPDLI